MNDHNDSNAKRVWREQSAREYAETPEVTGQRPSLGLARGETPEIAVQQFAGSETRGETPEVTICRRPGSEEKGETPETTVQRPRPGQGTK